MSADFARRVVSHALLRQGLPYVWGGKGLLRWTPTAPEPMPLSAGCNEAYDCVGLVTGAVHIAGGPDVRFLWSCQQLWDLLPPPAIGEPRRLRLFGPSTKDVQHVSIELGPDYQLEAAGGDKTTTNYEAAVRRGAKVRVSDVAAGRSDLLGHRSLSAMQFVNPNRG